MDTFAMSLFAQILGAQARIAAMQAANQASQMSGVKLMPYGESDFRDEANMIDHLAESLRIRSQQ